MGPCRRNVVWGVAYQLLDGRSAQAWCRLSRPRAVQCVADVPGARIDTGTHVNKFCFSYGYLLRRDARCYIISALK